MSIDSGLGMCLIVCIFKGINSLDDLANQKEIKYGTVGDSATEKFFETQNSVPYTTAYNFMKQENTYVGNTSVGIQQVNASYGKPKGSWFSSQIVYI